VLSVELGVPGRRRGSVGRRVQRSHARPDLLAVVAVATLVAVGLAHLQSLGAHSLAVHQAAAVVVGVVLLLVLRQSRSGQLRKLAWACYALSNLLLAVVAVFGSSSYGARRWLGFGSVTFQPSELAKVGLLLTLAQVLSSSRPWYQRLGIATVVAALPIGLVVLEPDLSTATVLAALTVTMLVLGRIPLLALGAAVGAVAAAAPFAEHLLHPYQLARLHAFLDGSTSADGPGWTIQQAHIALAWGGTTGQSQQPMHLLIAQYLPERESDLAFASVIEQRGIVAGVVIVVAAAALVWRLAAAARHARTQPAGLAAAGFAALIGVEVLISVAANLGLLPTAGVPLPLVSYGGTAAVVHIAAVGLVLGMRAEAQTHELWVMPRWRRVHPRLVRLTAFGVTGALIAMIGFAWNLQQHDGATLRAAGLTQMTRCVRIPAPRGVVTDRHGTPLVRDTQQDRVWIVPALVHNAARQRLAALIAQPVTDIDRAAAASKGSIAVDLGPVPSSVAARVTHARLTGVLVVPDPGRVYPYGALLAPVLGWIGVATSEDMKRWPDLPLGAIVGRAGIEQQYDSILRGTDGQQCVYVDPSGVPVRMGPRTNPLPGHSLKLSLDLGLQTKLSTSLASALHSGSAPADLGGGVVLDPRSGQVLAMASLPSYDDNVFGPPVDQAALAKLEQRTGHPQLQHVTQAVAPPGSTFKLVVAAADMVHRVLPPDEVVPTGGAWTLDGHTFHNWSDLPAQDLPQAIAWSNDVYFYKLAWQLGPSVITEVAGQLGVGRPTGIDLPGESSGYLGTPKSVKQDGQTWYPGSTVLLGIGQGYLDVTPLQDAVWTAGVATGSVITPHLGMAYGAGGRETALSWPAARRLSFANRLGPVREGMRQVVTNGTALALQGLPVPVGGKTGTAEDPTAPGAATDSWLSAVAPFHPSGGAPPVVEATAYVHGGDGHDTSTQIVYDALTYFFAHEKAILAS
jgi:cell division protein FtsI/penicillin-binding protein 2/cell division protein FtsW (lipid II flippase)